MKILNSLYPFALSARSSRPPVLNLLADSEEEDAPAPAKGEDDPAPPTSQEDDPDAPDDQTPAGKKFAQMRKEKKVAEEAARSERDARLIAEAKAQAYEEAMAQFNPQKPQEKPEDKIEVDPDDFATIQRSMRKMGLDPAALKANAGLQQQMQQMLFEQQMDRAMNSLEKKYQDSVPLDREKVIQYVRENKLLASLNAPLDRVFDIAHKEMNEEAFAEWRYQQRTKNKKETPKISDNGTGKKEIREEKPDDYAGWRKRAMEIAG